MHAAIFDIDGTLLDSYGIDNSMYADAVRSALGTVVIRDAWEKYTRVTDTGVLADICSDNSLVYDGSVSTAVMNVYLGFLRSHMEAKGPYKEMPGALQYLNTLRRRPDVRVAYATGGWRATAEHKLMSAGFPLEGIPLASADDYQDRTQIMLHALGQLEGPFTSVTYFGDGLWDRAAAAQLGWEFVAVGPKLGGLSNFGAAEPPASSDSSRWRSEMVKPAKNTICLWYDGDAEDAARFYAKTFPDSSVGAVHRAPGDFHSGKKGDVLTVEFTVMGVPCLGLNGGPTFKHNEAFSFQVATADQAETDRYWNAIVGNGGQESACGWCKDKWGLSWQISPIALTNAVFGPDAAAAKRAFDAMMTMKKIDIAVIEAAVRG